MKPATLSHNHMCIPSACPCCNSFIESINSRAWTYSHKYATHCPAHIEANLLLQLSHRHTLTASSFRHCSILHTFMQTQSCCAPKLCVPSAHPRGQTQSLLSSVPSACNSDQQHPGTTRGSRLHDHPNQHVILPANTHTHTHRRLIDIMHFLAPYPNLNHQN